MRLQFTSSPRRCAGSGTVILVVLLLSSPCVARAGRRDGDPLSSSSRSLAGLDSPDGLGGTAGTVGIVFALGTAAMLAHGYEDDDPQRLDGNRYSEPFTDVGNWFGNGLTLGAATAGVMALGRVRGDPGVTALGNDLAESLLASAAIVWILKPTVRERRPDGGKYSFPSGHTAAAFAVAPVVARYLGPWAGAGAYTLATFTAVGRVEDRHHHMADVLFGAAIGIACGREVSRGRHASSLLRHLEVAPSGVALTGSF